MDEERDRSSEGTLPRLPDHIIVDILARLPVKSLMRFRCVCKPWLTLFSSSQFDNLHFECSMEDTKRASVVLSNDSLYFLDYGANDDSDDHAGDLLSVELHFPLLVETNSVQGRIRILGSCGGLLCVKLKGDNIFIINPYTRESKKISDSHAVPCNQDLVIHGDVYGFGYDYLSRTYKAVRIDNQRNFTVYNLKTNTWRRKGKFPYEDVYDDGVHLHGAIHWVVRHKKDGKFVYSITAFDLAEEKFWDMQVPNEINTSAECQFRLLLRGECLCVLCFTSSCYDFWVMKEYGQSEWWTEEFNLDISDYEYFLTPLCFLQYDKMILTSPETVTLYNLNDYSTKQIAVPGDPLCLSAELCMKSLTSPTQFGNLMERTSYVQ